jgi:hypothetical protein
LPLGELPRAESMKRRAVVGMTLGLALVGAGWVALVRGCHEAPTTLYFRFPAGSSFDAGDVVFSPPDAVLSARVGANGWLAVVTQNAGEPLRLAVPGMCPVSVIPSAGKASPLEIVPWLELGGDRAQAGFDSQFEIRVRPGCSEAMHGEIVWRQLEGPPLIDMHVDESGFYVSARTQPFSALHPDPAPHGICPISPNTQGKYVLEATWRAEGIASVRQTITVTSIARATGVDSLAVTQRVVLGGEGWHVVAAPLGAKGQVSLQGGLTTFAADVGGRWRLADRDGKELVIHASEHDQTPLDCGRSGCHAEIADLAATSGMSHALEAVLAGDGKPGSVVTCMLDCHATGERGLRDSGFLDTSRTLGWSWLGSTRWQDLPRALRRVGGVHCSACHGPGAMPERDARSAILRSDVCATCHDAPPLYVHVQQWRASRMARSDLTPETRRSATCARCHTTAGFLSDVAVRVKVDSAAQDEVVGIACSACHAPHGPHRSEKLLRALDVPEDLGGLESASRYGSSVPCLKCHSAGPDEAWPSASAATVWFGRVRIPATGDVVAGETPHRDVPGGCVGCHGGLQASTGRPTDHSFRVDDSSCATCHGGSGSTPKEQPKVAGRSVRDWALALEDEIERRLASKRLTSFAVPRHAAQGTAQKPADDIFRARYEVALVLEDPAAGIHNAPFARTLLADAEQHLRSAAARGAR